MLIVRIIAYSTGSRWILPRKRLLLCRDMCQRDFGEGGVCLSPINIRIETQDDSVSTLNCPPEHIQYVVKNGEHTCDSL